MRRDMNSTCTQVMFCFSRHGCGIRQSTSMKRAWALPAAIPRQRRSQTGISAACNSFRVVFGKAASKSSAAAYAAILPIWPPTPPITSRKPRYTEKIHLRYKNRTTSVELFSGVVLTGEYFPQTEGVRTCRPIYTCRSRNSLTGFRYITDGSELCLFVCAWALRSRFATVSNWVVASSAKLLSN